LATFGDLEKFLRNDGWTEEPNLVRGRRRGADHKRYQKPQPSGNPLRTKVSRHAREEIGADLFKRILGQQLRVTEDHFWEVVRGGVPLAGSAGERAPQGKPGWLVQRLIATAGMSEEQVAALSTEDALAAWHDYRSKPRR
jgi:predicted RNA binding protein YcfA (HicA-like mRNA interferase family)